MIARNLYLNQRRGLLAVLFQMACSVLLTSCDGCQRQKDSDEATSLPSDIEAEMKDSNVSENAAKPEDLSVKSEGELVKRPDVIAAIEKVKTTKALETIQDKAGSGDTAQAGQKVAVHYTGFLTNGQKFDSSRDRGQAFEFGLGQGQVISGWDQGVAGMKVGERRILIIPSEMGYGARGAGSVIPPDSTLVFDVELMAVSGAGQQ